MTNGEEQLESLKALYGAHLEGLHALRERSFATTVQSLSLNVVVLAGLIAGRIALLPIAKVLGSLVLAVFGALVCAYLIFKGRGYRKLKTALVAIERALVARSGLPAQSIGKREADACSFWTGSGIFCVAVGICTACTIAALWVPLVVPPVRPPDAASVDTTATVDPGPTQPARGVPIP